MTSFHIVAPGRDGGAGDGGLHGVDRRCGCRSRAGPRCDHRDHAGDLLGFGDRLGARPGRLAADVEDVRALGDQPRGRGRAPRSASRNAPAVGEAVRGDVDDPHDSTFPLGRVGVGVSGGDGCDSPPRLAAATLPSRGGSLKPARRGAGRDRDGGGTRGERTDERGPGGPIVRLVAARRDALQHAVDLLAAQGLVLEQRLGQRVQVVELLGQDALGLVVAALDQALDLGVDDLGGVFGDVLGARHRVAQEHLFLVVAVGDDAERVGVAPAGDHVARQLGRLADVAARRRR